MKEFNSANQHPRLSESLGHLLVQAAWFVGVILLWWGPIVSLGQLYRLQPELLDPSLDDRSGYYFAGALPIVVVIAVCGTVAFVRLLSSCRNEPRRSKTAFRIVGCLLAVGLWSWFPQVALYFLRPAK